MEEATISLFACWFQPGLISQPTVFSSCNKSAPAKPRNQPANRLNSCTLSHIPLTSETVYDADEKRQRGTLYTMNRSAAKLAN